MVAGAEHPAASLQVPRAAQESETTGTKCALCWSDLLRRPRNDMEVSNVGCGDIPPAAGEEAHACYSGVNAARIIAAELSTGKLRPRHSLAFRAC